MDWTLAIERNREALKRIVAMLVAMAELGGDVTTLPRRVHRAVLGLLRPAESAVRRLIVIAARGLVVAPSPQRAQRRKSVPSSIFVRHGIGTGIVLPPGALPGPSRPAPRSISLPLLDPLGRPFRRRRARAKGIPRIFFSGLGAASPVAAPRVPSPDDRLDTTRLALRIGALAAALDDIPGQARRFARWRANRAITGAPENRDISGAQDRRRSRRYRRIWPFRPGRPPGSRRRSSHEVHAILAELHALAFEVLEHPDTS